MLRVTHLAMQSMHHLTVRVANVRRAHSAALPQSLVLHSISLMPIMNFVRGGATILVCLAHFCARFATVEPALFAKTCLRKNPSSYAREEKIAALGSRCSLFPRELTPVIIGTMQQR